MVQRIVYVDTSAIREGKLEELKEAMRRLATFVEENVPEVISYGFFLDREEREMTVVAVHPDLTSLAHHLDVGAAEFSRFASLIELLAIEVYGRIDESVLERLHRKARMLGNGTVKVGHFYAGFDRSRLITSEREGDTYG